MDHMNTNMNYMNANVHTINIKYNSKIEYNVHLSKLYDKIKKNKFLPVYENISNIVKGYINISTISKSTNNNYKTFLKIINQLDKLTELNVKYNKFNTFNDYLIFNNSRIIKNGFDFEIKNIFRIILNNILFENSIVCKTYILELFKNSNIDVYDVYFKNETIFNLPYTYKENENESYILKEINIASSLLCEDIIYYSLEDVINNNRFINYNICKNNLVCNEIIFYESDFTTYTEKSSLYKNNKINEYNLKNNT